jgi:hypothetical protein
MPEVTLFLVTGLQSRLAAQKRQAPGWAPAAADRQNNRPVEVGEV